MEGADPRRRLPAGAPAWAVAVRSSGAIGLPQHRAGKVIEVGVDFERLEDALIPVEVVATSLTDGQERWFAYGSAMEAVLASTAVPASLPPVEIDGQRYIDGGVLTDVPMRAVESGATRIVMLLLGRPGVRRLPRGAP